MEEVSSYVRDNPHSTVRDICENLDVKEKLVRRMIREGRFEMDGINFEYPCEKCGAPITQGKLCLKCAEELKKELQGAAAKIVAGKEKNRNPGQRGSGEHASAFRSERERQNASKQSDRYRGLR